MSVNRSARNELLYRGPSIDASYQVSVHLTKQFQRKFLEIDQSETRGSAHWACITHLTIDWYWSKFQREIIITLKTSSHLEWRVGLSDTILKGTHPGTIYARFGPYIDASCQVWLHLAKLFQRRRFFYISQSEKRINLGDHVCRPNGTKWRSFIEDLT